MISNQILQTTLDGLKSISRVDFAVIDTDGNPVVSTTLPSGGYAAGVIDFVKSPADYDESGGIKALQIAKGRTIIYDMDNRAESYPDVNKAAEEMKETITEGQAQTLNEMISETGTDRKAFMEYYKVDSFMKMTKEQYGDALNILHNKKLKAEEKGKVIGTE